MNDKNLYFHIGAPKTATTLIQHVLNQNKIKLQNKGYDIILPLQIRKTGFYKYIFAEHTNRDTDITLESAQNDFESIIRNCQNDNVILSEEGFTQHLMPVDKRGRGFTGIQKSMATIKAIIPKTSKIILTIRNQVDFIESVYKHKIKWKFCSLLLEEFLDKHIDIFNISWARVIKEIEDYFPGRLEIIPFELLKISEKRFFNRFLTSFQIVDNHEFFETSETVKNESLADNHALFMRSLNQSIKQLEGFHKGTRPKIKVRFINELLEDEPRRSLPEFKISKSISRQIKSFYKNENHDIFNKYCSQDDISLLDKYY